MANPGEIFISFEKPKQSAKAFFYVSEGMLSDLHTERVSKKLDLKVLESNRRSLLHYSSYLDLQALTLYLLMAGVDYTVLDKNSQSCFFGMFAKGNYKTLQIFLNYQTHIFMKELHDWTTLLKFGFNMQSVTLRNTVAFYLSKTLTFTKLPDKPVESKLELGKRLEMFYKKIVDTYKFILCTQDNQRRNPLHYAALSKFTWCFKVVEGILSDLDGFSDFCSFFSQIQPLHSSQTVDPCRYRQTLPAIQEILSELFEKLHKDFQKALETIKATALNTKDRNGHTPLHLACLSGDFKIVKLLIEHGANKSIPDNKNQKPLDLCSTKLVMRYLSSLAEVVTEKDSKALVHMANSGYDVNVPTNTYMLSGLHLAVLNGALVKSVLNFEGKVDQSEWNGYTALHIACVKGSGEDVVSLLKEKANVMARSTAGLTPLHLACHHDKVQVIRILLDGGADINAVDHSGRTSLMLASKHGSLKSVKELLTLRCNYLLTDTRGWNCLHYASFHCKSKVVKLLVKWDSDSNSLVSSKNSQSRTPLSLTSDIKTRKAFDNLWNAASNGNLDLARRLLRNKADVNEATVGERKTALMMAAASNHILMVKFLIENGAKVDMIDNNGRNAVEYVRADGNPKIKVVLEMNSRKKPQTASHVRTNSF